LAGGSGQSKVTPANDFGAWLYSPSLDAWPRKVVREGDPGFAEGERIKSFQLLEALKDSPGQGRGHYADKAVSFVASLSSKRQALVRFRAGIVEAECLTGEFVGEALPAVKWKSFGLQATNRDGALAVRATLQSGAGGVTKANASGIFLNHGAGQAFEPVARLGDEAFGIPGASFSVLSDPLVSGPSTAVAFIGCVKGQGVRANNSTGIWWADQSGWSLVARTGTQAAEGPDLAFWKSFNSFALPDGERGPIFEATLAKGGGAVNASNDMGLWAVDSLGEVRLLVREQDVVEGKMLKSFSALQAVSGSAGVRRSFNNAGQLVYRAYFSDGSQSVMKVQVP
jgi:hypothetical protein